MSKNNLFSTYNPKTIKRYSLTEINNQFLPPLLGHLFRKIRKSGVSTVSLKTLMLMWLWKVTFYSTITDSNISIK